MQSNRRMGPMTSMGPTRDVSYGGSPFPPIADYGFLSDCETTALVAPSGNIEWLCVPRLDSASVFGAILDRDAGGFRFGPAEWLWRSLTYGRVQPMRVAPGGATEPAVG